MEGLSESGPALIIGLCHYCKIPRPLSKSMRRCGGCQLVAYCSIDCQKDDRGIHKYICKEFAVTNGKNVFHTTRPWKEHIADLTFRAACVDDGETYIFVNPRVCKTCHEPRQERLTDCICNCVSYCSRRCKKADTQHRKDCTYLAQLAWSRCEHFMYLSYPMSLYYALLSLGVHSFGQVHQRLHEADTLNVHIVINQPLMDPELWEMGFMELLPNLKHLKLTFIIQGNEFKKSCDIMKNLSHYISKDRVITYFIRQMHYHMYFSSPQYTEPDVVVVYRNSHEMLANVDGDIHSEISYRNMTYSRDTVLVLTDVTEDLVKQGVSAVNTARPVDQLLLPKINELRGWGSNRSKLETDADDINDKYYFVCLSRK